VIKRFLKWLRDLFSWRCLLSYDELLKLIEDGVIDAPKSAVQGSTIDLTLHRYVKTEAFGPKMDTVYLARGQSITMVEHDIREDPHILKPDAVMLASTNEYFNMPCNLSAEFSLKSTLGRSFVGHQLAGWIDPYFKGKITLEITNDTQFHRLAFEENMPIGQVKFFRHKKVPFLAGYAKRGQYNGQDKVTEAGILK